MARVYPRADLERGLAAFGARPPMPLNQLLRPDEPHWQSVLQLTVLSRGERGFRVLNGTRCAASNQTHPNVISTPTGLLPQAVAAALYHERAPGSRILSDIHLDTVTPDRLILGAEFPPWSCANRLPQNDSVLGFAVGGLMCRKLGLAPALETTSTAQPVGRSYLSTISAGFSYATDSSPNADGVCEPLFEPLLMFGVVVELDDPTIVPAETIAYRHLTWTPIADYEEGVRTRRIECFNPGLIDPAVEMSRDQVTVCARGLCLQAAKLVFDQADSPWR